MAGARVPLSDLKTKAVDVHGGETPWPPPEICLMMDLRDNPTGSTGRCSSLLCMHQD